MSIADDLLGRNGRMVDAIRAIGPGAAAYEAVPFRLRFGVVPHHVRKRAPDSLKQATSSTSAAGGEVNKVPDLQHGILSEAALIRHLGRLEQHRISQKR